jgi:hypothetical protein
MFWIGGQADSVREADLSVESYPYVNKALGLTGQQRFFLIYTGWDHNYFNLINSDK